MLVKRILTVLALVVLSNCTHLYELERVKPADDSFSAALAREYHAFALSEQEQMDWYDSDYFAKKGLRAARGMEVLPEVPDDWDVPSDSVDQLVLSFKRLMDVLASDVRKNFPEDSAHAQLLYDCWLEQLEERWQEEDIETCRMRFLTQIAMLETRMVTSGSEVPPIYYQPPTVNVSETVFFGFDKDRPRKSFKTVVAKVVEAVKDLSDFQVKLEGHADRVGPKEYNEKLSQRRVDFIKSLLLESGVSDDHIQARAFGERRPKFPTDDGVAEPLNRRVEINVYGR